MPNPCCKKCHGKGEYEHCEGCREWCTCECSMNDSPPTDDDDSATVAEFFESMLENGGAMSLPLGLTLSFDTSEQRYVIQQGDIIIERRVTLVNIIEAAKEIGAW